MGLNIGMLIEIVVALLLVLTIAYCMVLNRRLTRLRADEEVLRATIAELITATEIAERAILGLKATAADCEKSLGSRLSTADGTIAELERRISLGDDVLRRLIAASRVPEARQEPAPRPASESTYREAPPAEPVYREPPMAEQPYHPPAPRHAPAMPGYGFAVAPQSAPTYSSGHDYGYPARDERYGHPVTALQPAPAPPPREPVARSLQAAAEAAAERLSAYRRAQREEAA